MQRRRITLIMSACALSGSMVLPFPVAPAQAHHRSRHAATTTTSSSTTSTTLMTSTSASGEPIPVGDLPQWRHIFADDFTTDVPLGSFPSAVSDKWTAYPDGWKDTSKKGTYSPSKVVSIDDGKMNLNLHTEGGTVMVAAPVPMLPGIDGTKYRLYGRYAVRFRADAVAGYKTAWLLWPQSAVWPRDGEIDFPEGNLDRSICAFMHRQHATSGRDQDAFCTSTTFPTWHTAVTEWGPNEVRFILDGKTIGVATARIPNTPMRWVLQTETTLDSTLPDPAASANVEIDWVSAWAYTG